MEDFTPQVLKGFIARGCKFLLYGNMEHFAFISPLFDERDVDEQSYIIPIEDEQCMEMAQDVDNFSFYVLNPFG
jgi:hypothetical protein